MAADYKAQQDRLLYQGVAIPLRRIAPKGNWRGPQGAKRRTKQEAREKFDAVRWNYWEAVAWVCYRDPARLHDLLLGLPRREKWYNGKEHQADQQLRQAIQRQWIKAFDASGNDLKPLADIGTDPQVNFASADIKHRWSLILGSMDNATGSGHPSRSSVETAPTHAGSSETIRQLTGAELDEEIRNAIYTAINTCAATAPDSPLNGKQQATHAMKILRSRQIAAEKGGLRRRVEKIADSEFASQRRRVGLRKK